MNLARSRFPILRPALAAVLTAGVLIVPAPLDAQRPAPAQPVDGISQPDAAPAQPVNGVITAIDARTGLVTARHVTTGGAFRFRVADRGLLRGLAVGQSVYGAEGTGKVGITPGTPCCSIVALAGPINGISLPDAAPAQPVDGALPVNGVITAIDARTGLVTARHVATGETFRFRVADRGLLRGLVVGQSVYGAEGTGKVGITAGEPCCEIVAPPGPADGSVTWAPREGGVVTQPSPQPRTEV